jgi:hypothetical protein
MPKKIPVSKKISKAALKIKRISKAKKDNKKNEKKSKIEKAKPEILKPKRNTKQNNKRNNGEILELGLLMDCTGSMASWIDRAKKTL